MIKHILLFIILLSFSCQPEKNTEIDTNDISESSKGGLFIIGGGSRPAEMIDALVKVSSIKEGKGFILPMASADDSAFYYANLQFQERGIHHMKDYTVLSHTEKNSLSKASLIYLAGGDQRKLMEALSESERKAIKIAYENGAVIAGTSAGAAVMSHLMITGDEKKHPDYQPTFRTIEKDNIIFDSGLALLPQRIIIDQHFVYRSRYNRLLTAIMEMPDHKGIGIDESTAIYVKNDSATVYGEWQVITFENKSGTTKHKTGIMGAENIQLNIYLPSEKFKLSQ
ncbi:cyanophycinase [Marivirga sp. S37H4]|uniref:Cyanophycinase n=1 Tax=Marivirga aurantiaca TaxID=2802615 RepID=A0A934X1T4_9BACT|nr:cyanophycinase [Marivirga aurantiaca]MBK6266887.1 cyanophycinase [Marivirga aurantiaca]